LKTLSNQLAGLLEDVMHEYERFVRLELERVGLGISRWLAEFWQRVPYDDWLAEIESVFVNLEHDQVFVDEESRKAFIAWLAAVTAAAKERAEQLQRQAEAATRGEVIVRPPIPRRMPPSVEKLLPQILAEIEKKPRDQWLKEVRELLDELDLPPQVEADLLAHYAELHARFVNFWNLLWKSPGPRAGPPETIPDVIFRVLAGLDKFIAEGRLDELLDALRELVRRMPELIPPGARGGEIEELVRKLQELMRKFLDLLEELPPEAGEVALELLQLALDIAGMVAGPGELFDLLSMMISARRGQWLDVGLSVFSGALLLGMAFGAAKIFARLKKLAAMIGKLKGPAREILTSLITALTKELKTIPLGSVRGAIDGIKRFVKRLRALLDEAIGRLRKATRRGKKQKAPKPGTPPPSLFGGLTFQEWGVQVIKWGRGAAGAAARRTTITIEELLKDHVTIEQAEAARDFYLKVMASDFPNPAAAGRIELMNRRIDLLKGA
jgi:hypothetical protein